MEININDIHEYIKYRTYKYKLGENQFICWFRSKLMSTSFEEIEEDFDKVFEYQKTAEVFCDKIENMIYETNNGNCNFDSIMRMICRICDKGVKIIPDQRNQSQTEGNTYLRYRHKNKSKHTANTCVGFVGVKAHFRWNFQPHTLHIAYINTLIQIVKEMKYFDINPEADMGSLYEE